VSVGHKATLRGAPARAHFPGLMTTASSCELLSLWMHCPKSLDWNNCTSTPMRLAHEETQASMSFNVHLDLSRRSMSKSQQVGE
jgi:hypothetical protein